MIKNLPKSAAQIGAGLVLLSGVGSVYGAPEEVATEAAESSEKNQGRMIEEVVVTARRKTESLQDVPVSVSALSADKLEQAGIDNAFDLQGNTPSFTISASNVSRSTPFLMIRGQKANDTVLTVDPAVSVYVNEVPITRVQGLGVLAILDTATLEVLKGPQGTLFGKNTTGGALVIHSKRPEDDFGGSLKYTASNFNGQKTDLEVNVPITDWLAMRAAAYKETRDPTIENRSDNDDLYDVNDFAWRFTMTAAFGDKFETTFFADGYETSNNGPASTLTAVDPMGITNLVSAGGHQAALERQQQADYYSTETNLSDAFEELDVFGASNTTTYDFDNGIRAKLVLGYREIDSHTNYDLDGSSLDLLRVEEPVKTEQVSAELQFQGDLFDGRVDWTVGGLYFKEKGHDIITGFVLATDTVINYKSQNESESLYGAFTWHILDDLRLALGVRQTVDTRSIALGGPTDGDAEEEFTEPTWDINLGYDINDDTMAYIAHRHGYRSGGFNARAPSGEHLEPFAPEFVDDIELGLKTSFEMFGTSVQLNMAAFYSDYQDLQRGSLVVTEEGAITVEVQTAANATIYGGEFEWTWLPTENLDVTGYVSMQKARYDEWNTPAFFTNIDGVDTLINSSGLLGQVISGNVNGATGGAFQQDVDISDNKFAGVPDFMANITLRYRLPFLSLEMGDMYIQGSAAWQDDTEQFEKNTDTTLQEAYTLYNARFEWNNILSSAFSLNAWVKNITEEEYMSGATSFNDDLGFVVQHRADPRSYGIGLSFDF